MHSPLSACAGVATAMRSELNRRSRLSESIIELSEELGRIIRLQSGLLEALGQAMYEPEAVRTAKGVPSLQLILDPPRVMDWAWPTTLYVCPVDCSGACAGTGTN